MFPTDDDTERFYIDANGPDDDALREGFAWLRAQAGFSAAVCVPGLQNVDYLARVLGKEGAQKLKRERALRERWLTVELWTERTMPVTYTDGPVLAVWANDARLVKLDALGAPALCAIPWLRDNIKQWKTNWNPTELRGNASASPELSVGPVVAVALDDLTHVVNLASGLVHPADKTAAVELFKILKRGHESFDPSQVQAWAARHEWEPRHARELGEMAGKILEGRPVQRGRNTPKMWRDDILDVWRAKAAN